MLQRKNYLKIISQCLYHSSVPLSINEIKKITGINRNTLSKYLSILVTNGEIGFKQSGTAKLYFVCEKIPERIFLKISQDAVCTISFDFILESYNLSFYKCFINETPKWEKNHISQLSSDFFDPILIQLIHSALNGENAEAEKDIRITDTIYHYKVKAFPLILTNQKFGVGLLFRDLSESLFLNQALLESENRYRSIVEDQLDLICRRAPDLSILYVNKSYCNASHYSEHDLLGKVIFPFSVTSNNTESDLFFKLISPENSFLRIETRYDQYSNTQPSWYEWIIRGIFSSDGMLVEYQAVGRNISYQKELENQNRVFQNCLELMIQRRTQVLQDTNQKLLQELNKKGYELDNYINPFLLWQTIFQDLLSPCALFEFNQEKNNYYIIAVNPSFCNLLGYPEDELLRMCLSQFLTDESLKFDSKEFIIKIKFCPLFTGIQKIKRKSGDEFPADVAALYFPLNGKNYILMFFKDLSLINAFPVQSDDRSSFFSYIVDDISTVIYIADLQENLIYLNNAGHQFLKNKASQSYHACSIFDLISDFTIEYISINNKELSKLKNCVKIGIGKKNNNRTEIVLFQLQVALMSEINVNIGAIISI